MRNGIKPQLREKQLDAIARHVCDKPAVLMKELTDGWANAAYLVALVDGTEMIVKAAPEQETSMMRYEQGLMRTEAETMRLVGTAGTIPVPRILAYDDTLRVVPYEYMVMEKLDGAPYNKVKEALSEAERESIEEELGVYSRRINAFKGERFGLYAAPAEAGASWKEVFQDLLMGVLADGEERGVELPASYEAVRSELEARLPALGAVTEPRLVHWDLWDGNVFVKDGRIVGLIDFERALWGDPLLEAYFGKFHHSPGFLRGYGYPDGLTEEQRERRRLYNLYLDLILRIECAFRGYTDEGHIEWTKQNMTEGWRRFLSGD